jgi:hypothetical protein
VAIAQFDMADLFRELYSFAVQIAALLLVIWIFVQAVKSIIGRK